jgi:hypothetical protein
VRSVGLANFDDALKQIAQLGAELTINISGTEMFSPLVAHQCSLNTARTAEAQDSATKVHLQLNRDVFHPLHHRLGESWVQAADGGWSRVSAGVPLRDSAVIKHLAEKYSVQPWVGKGFTIHHHRRIIVCACQVLLFLRARSLRDVGVLVRTRSSRRWKALAHALTVSVRLEEEDMARLEQAIREFVPPDPGEGPGAMLVSPER